MFEVEVIEEIEAPSDAVWAVVRDFGNCAWMKGSPRVEVQGEGPGMLRIIHAMPDSPPIHERLEAVDEDARRVDYSIPENNPMPCDEYRASITVADAGEGRTRIEWRGEATPKGMDADAAKKAVEGMYGLLISWVREHVEAA